MTEAVVLCLRYFFHLLTVRHYLQIFHTLLVPQINCHVLSHGHSYNATTSRLLDYDGIQIY